MKKSTNVNSRYSRIIKDLPIQEYKVILNITAKVFFCKNKNCPTNTFAEQFDFIESLSRMTTRLKEKITKVCIDDVAEWLKTYPNLEVISKDDEIMYKSASDKAHPKSKQISDRFHVLKNLIDYARDVLKRLFKKQIKIKNENQTQENSVSKKKYEYKTKWDLISKVQKLRKKEKI